MPLCAVCKTWLAELDKNGLSYFLRMSPSWPEQWRVFRRELSRNKSSISPHKDSCGLCYRLQFMCNFEQQDSDLSRLDTKARSKDNPTAADDELTLIVAAWTPPDVDASVEIQLKSFPRCSLKFIVATESTENRLDDALDSYEVDDLSDWKGASIANLADSGDADTDRYRSYLDSASSTPLEKNRIEMIKSWLSHCTENHENCRIKPHPAGERPFLPKRLLRIIENDSRIFLELVETERFGVDVPEYVTLSHCWGSTPFLTLTSQNQRYFKHMYRGFGRTFKETIQLCLALGFQYMWIDSLCIIQDSKPDWNSQAPNMHNIYGNALFNIAATASDACEKGLFRDPVDQLKTGLEISLPGGHTMRHDCNGLASLMGSYYERSPLLARGWVMQELMLAPRVLHWTDTQIFFQCRDTVLAEIAPPSLSTVAESPGNISTLLLKNAPADATDGMWTRIISSFSSTKVTKPEDVYFALSGLAALFYENYSRAYVQTRYVAGCWEHNLVRWLSWYQHELKSASDVEEAPNANVPSWSWLKIRGRGVEVGSEPRGEGTLRTVRMSVDRVRVESDSMNLFGPVISARIFVEAPVLEFGGADFSSFVGNHWLKALPGVMESHGKVLQLESPLAIYTSAEGIQISIDDGTALYGSSKCKCALLSTESRGTTGDGYQGEYVARLLILMSRSDQEQTYRRVGYLGFRLSREYNSLSATQVEEFLSDDRLSTESLVLM